MSQTQLASSRSSTRTMLPEIPPTAEDLKKSRVSSNTYRHTFPVHTKSVPSPLSKEAPPESYRGFVNLGLLLLFGNNLRLIIENYQKYGILISFPGSKVSKEDWILTTLSHILLPLNVILAFQFERWAKKRALGYRKRLASAAAVASGGMREDQDLEQLLKEIHKIEASARTFQSFVGWLHALNFFKMTSYALVHQDLRAAYIFDQPTDKFQHLAKVHDTSSGKTSGTQGEIYHYEVQYPDNVKFTNVAYFWFAPTLCYQPSYPRTVVFRKSFFFKRIMEVITCIGMMYFLIEQYATPTLQNSIRAFDQLAFGTLLERVLKLSTTSVLIWLLMFYTFFHATFNAIAELLYFGDRCFYLAWWNAGSVEMYWRLWNKPIYMFFKRHVYLPLVISGTSPLVASFIIFTLSAIMHEIVVGFPTHLVYGYAFAGMFFQIPLIAVTRPLEKWRGTGTGLGNMIFWVSFTILGQPACALLYYYHWTKRHMNDDAPVLT
ncbi:hypothetical protein BGX27_003745 [Mortierella sp. AM989]|nr:hypothetical protein BGX27_003745 [Mortierella sp. AM989]